MKIMNIMSFQLFTSMFSRTLLIYCWANLVALTVNAKSTLIANGHLLFTRVRVTHNQQTRDVLALIDTGASVNLIDSTFAVDSFQINSTNSNATIGNTLGKRIKSFDFNLDSISLDNTICFKSRCFVIDLASKFKDPAINLVLGGDFLKRRKWCFDLKSYKISCDEIIPADTDIEASIKWGNENDYSDAALNSIYIKGKISGIKTRIFFDTGSIYNDLPLNFNIPTTEYIELSGANIAETQVKKKVCRCLNINTDLKCYNTNLDFVKAHDKYPRINMSLFWGKKIILDYDRKVIYILKERER